MTAPSLDFESIAGARKGRLRRRVVASTVVVVIVAVAAVAFVSVASSSDARWRTAVAGTHDVRSTIDGITSIEPVREATTAFPVAGTVATVSVAKGDRVLAGQALAAMDPGSLTQTLHQKQAALANAQLTLQKAIDAQNAAATSTTAASPTTTPGGSLAQQIAAAQRAVTTAQRNVDTAMAQAAAAVTASQAPCAAPSTGPEIAACQTALNAVTTAQAQVQTAQQQLATATNQLDALLAQQASSTTTTPGGGSSRTPTSAVPSAADIAADQAAVDAAQLSVNVAEQNLTATTLVSPLDGTVVAVNFVAGQTVTANSTTQTIVIQGPGGFEATMNVSVDLIPRVHIGQEALVLPDAATVPVAARVAQISLAPTSSTVGTTAYRVTLALEGSSDKLAIGSIGTASIITAAASKVLAVPTSAVHTDPTTGDRMVTVLEGSTTYEAVVGVGIVGNDWTQITSGLTEGALVVLADLREPLPGAATTSKTSTASTLPGGGALPGGPGGGNFQPPAGGFGGGGGGPN